MGRILKKHLTKSLRFGADTRFEDEFFYVIKGEICIDTQEGSVKLKKHEGYLVKRGIRHRSRAEKSAWILLIEPIKTKTKGE